MSKVAYLSNYLLLVSSLNVAVVLTLITGFGGALAGYTFRAPIWAWPLLGIMGLFIGLTGAIAQNQFSVRVLDKADGEKGKGAVNGLCFVTKLVLPFLAVIVVTLITVTGSVLVTKAFWPEQAANPRDLGRLEGPL